MHTLLSLMVMDEATNLPLHHAASRRARVADGPAAQTIGESSMPSAAVIARRGAAQSLQPRARTARALKHKQAVLLTRPAGARFGISCGTVVAKPVTQSSQRDRRTAKLIK